MKFQNESEVLVSEYQEEVRMSVQSVIVNNNIINHTLSIQLSIHDYGMYIL